MLEKIVKYAVIIVIGFFFIALLGLEDDFVNMFQPKYQEKAKIVFSIAFIALFIFLGTSAPKLLDYFF